MKWSECITKTLSLSGATFVGWEVVQWFCRHLPKAWSCNIIILPAVIKLVQDGFFLDDVFRREWRRPVEKTTCNNMSYKSLNSSVDLLSKSLAGSASLFWFSFPLEMRLRMKPRFLQELVLWLMSSGIFPWRRNSETHAHAHVLGTSSHIVQNSTMSRVYFFCVLNVHQSRNKLCAECRLRRERILPSPWRPAGFETWRDWQGLRVAHACLSHPKPLHPSGRCPWLPAPNSKSPEFYSLTTDGLKKHVEK